MGHFQKFIKPMRVVSSCLPLIGGCFLLIQSASFRRRFMTPFSISSSRNCKSALHSWRCLHVYTDEFSSLRCSRIKYCESTTLRSMFRRKREYQPCKLENSRIDDPKLCYTRNCIYECICKDCGHKFFTRENSRAPQG